MKSLLTALLILIFALSPVLLYAQTSQKPMDKPPISQPLVSEGTFAVELANELKLGTTTNESEAESLLVGVGIVPRNGWIADYPVTPDIMGELQTSVSEAADSGRISMGKDEALKSFQDVATDYNLSVAAGQGAGEAPAANCPDSTVINNYYSEEGPPVVTYCAPPADYGYLYSWVPYPFWWSDFWFPGFFVLADFAFVVEFDGHHHHHHGHFHKGREFISNHFRDPSTGTISRIDPANRSNGRTFAPGSTRWSNPSAVCGSCHSGRTFSQPNRSSGPSWGRSSSTPHGGGRTSPGTGRGSFGGDSFNRGSFGGGMRR
jgi:hypothetical protein